MLDVHAPDEFRNDGYEIARLFKEKVKMWHDRKILKQKFHAGEIFFLFNSHFKLFPGKLRSRWEEPYKIKEVHNLGDVWFKGDRVLCGS